MAHHKEVILLALASMVFGVQGASIPFVYTHEQPMYVVRMSPVLSDQENVRVGLGAAPLSPLAAIPFSSPVATSYPLTKQGLAGSAKPFMADETGRQGSYLRLGTQGRGNGFPQSNVYVNQGTTVGQSGSTSAGAYHSNNRHADDIMTSSGHLNSAMTQHKSQQEGGQYESDQMFARDSKFKSENAATNGFKKGHHSSGFQSSYHKDESGHNTQFYDDDHREGQHVGSQDVRNVFDARGHSQMKNQGGQDNFQGVSRAQHQQFGAALNERVNSGQHQAQENEELYDHMNNYNGDST